MTTIYLIRHSEKLKIDGDYKTNESEQIKNEKIILSIEGEEKALELSKKAKLQGLDKVYTSHYTRAVATAKYIAAQNNLKLNIDERLGERKLGINVEDSMEKFRDAGVKKDINFTVAQLLDENLKSENGESNKEVRKRMLECINEIIQKNPKKRIAVVSHGAAIKYFIQNWCQYNYEKDSFFLSEKEVCQRILEAPSALELIFDEDKLINIEKI